MVQLILLSFFNVCQRPAIRLWALQLVNSTKVAQLPNPHKGNHEEVHSTSLSPERRNLIKAQNSQNLPAVGRWVEERFVFS